MTGLDFLPGDIAGQVWMPAPSDPICLNMMETARLWDGVVWMPDLDYPTDYDTEWEQEQKNKIKQNPYGSILRTTSKIQFWQDPIIYAKIIL